MIVIYNLFDLKFVFLRILFRINESLKSLSKWMKRIFLREWILEGDDDILEKKNILSWKDWSTMWLTDADIVKYK